MARSSAPKSGPSRVRLIVFEADLSDGDISQVTQAIQNALRPQAVVSRTVTTQTVKQLSNPVVDDEDSEDLNDEEIEAATPIKPVKSGKASKPRVAKTPDILTDLEFKSGQSLKSFVEQFDLKSGFEKYLAVALWFRDHRAKPAITVNHIYTAFRHLNWRTASTDFSKPLRNLRDSKLMGGGSDGYTINLIGEGKVTDKKKTINP